MAAILNFINLKSTDEQNVKYCVDLHSTLDKLSFDIIHDILSGEI